MRDTNCTEGLHLIFRQSSK